MAYPEAISVLKRKEAREFDEKSMNFSINEERVKKYAHSRKIFSLRKRNKVVFLC